MHVAGNTALSHGTAQGSCFSCAGVLYPVYCGNTLSLTCGLELAQVLVQDCYELSCTILKQDAFALEIMPAHLASAVELQKKNELFLRSHR